MCLQLAPFDRLPHMPGDLEPPQSPAALLLTTEGKCCFRRYNYYHKVASIAQSAV